MVLLGELLQEVARQNQDVAPSQAERRHLDLDDVEAVIEVLPEASGRDVGREVAVRRRDEAHVYLNGLVSADPLERPFLEDAQKLHLGSDRNLADLVEKQRPAVRLLEAPDAALVCAGEGAPLVPEELTLEKRLGEGGAVEGDEGLFGAGAEGVNRARELPFPGPALAGEEDGRPRRGDLAGDAVDLLHRWARPDEPLEPLAVALADLPPQVLRLHPELAPLEGTLDEDRQRVEVDWLREVILGPFAHRADRRAHVAEGGVAHDDGVSRSRSCRSFFRSSRPSMFGILRSVTTTSAGCSSNRSRAATPSSATSTE